MSGNSAQVNAATANKIVLTGFVPFFLKFARQFQALWNSPKSATCSPGLVSLLFIMQNSSGSMGV
jgi:hypothetical protein